MYAGGIGAWWRFFKDVAEPFDYKKKYPAGTFIIRKYRNIVDQGHVAIVYDENPKGVLFSKVVHCFTDLDYDEQTCKLPQGPGIAIDNNIGYSHFYYDSIPGYYDYAILPKDWL